MITRQQRYRGVLVGVHAGDSLGAEKEKTWSAARIAADIEAHGGLVLRDYPNHFADQPGNQNGPTLPAGHPTDDSDQTAVLAEHIIVTKGFDATLFRQRLVANVLEGHSLLWDGQSTGAGGSTIKALGADSAISEAARNNAIGTNGSLMRSAPMGLWLHGRLDTAAKEVVEAMSAVTHNHPHCRQACWIYTVTLSGLLAGLSPQEAFAACVVTDPTLAYSYVYQRLQLRLHDPADLPYDPGDWPARGAAEFSLYVALYALFQSASFASGVEQAIKVAGDTDTYGAIAGGLLGAYYGYEAIPQEWRTTLLGHDPMVRLADELYTLSASRV